MSSQTHTPEPIHLPSGYKIEADARFGGLAAYTPERALVGTSADVGALATACFANYGRKMDLALRGLDLPALPALIEAAEKVAKMLEDQSHRAWSSDPDSEAGCKDCGTDDCPTRRILPILRAALAKVKGGAA